MFSWRAGGREARILDVRGVRLWGASVSRLLFRVGRSDVMIPGAVF